VALGEPSVQGLKMLVKIENEKASGGIEMLEGWKKGVSLAFAFLEVD
jgi:hypothetical protein